MVVHLVKDNEVIETYTMCMDSDDVSEVDMKNYVYKKLLEVKKWR